MASDGSAQDKARELPIIECDIAIFGSGAAGLTAAVVAASEGLDVALFEKADQLGGTTATSGGAIWIPGNSQARRAGIDDPLAEARRFLAHELGNSYRAELVDAYLEAGAEAVDYLEARSDIRFEYVPAPDYVTDSPGAAVKGRCLSPLAFDGTQLGKNFGLVLPPRPAFMILGGLMVGRTEIPYLLRPYKSWKAFRHATGVILGYLRDRFRYARGTRLLMGNALIARALHSALKLGVSICPGTPLIRLESERGRVTGAVVSGRNGEQRVRARVGVVLAMGGFPHDDALRRRLAPNHPHTRSLASPGNTGDAIRSAEPVGAAVDVDVSSPAFWTPSSFALSQSGEETLFPYGHMDRGKPGAIIVDASGRRFVNEADSYHHVVLAMFEKGAIPPDGSAFIICDRDFIKRYGLGLVKPAPFPLGPHIRNGYLKTGRSLAELALQLDIDAAGLEEEVRRHNEFARTGVDADFGKGASVFNRFNGDRRGQPNACLLPIERGPFYAIAMVPSTLGTAAGLRTDGDARVLRMDGSPIEGLYACGNDMGSVVRGTYPGPGITIGPAMVFAYRAMRHAAREAA